MKPLSTAEQAELNKLFAAGKPLPEKWISRLIPRSHRLPETGREYRLVYHGKAKREEVLAQTPAAPWQRVRSFCEERPHEGGWKNRLVWGDNLLALRELVADQQGMDSLGTRGKIKLIYIDPPFATRQDFMKDKEKAYRDKILGAQFIEFLRRRLILLREILADDGSIFVHMDSKKGHYIKAALDELFGEENFVSEIIWRRTTAHFTAERFAFVHDTIFQYSRSGNFLFRKPPTGHSQDYLATKYKYEEPDGRRYRLSDASGAGPGESRMFFGRNMPPPAGRHWPSQGYIDEHLDEYVLREDGMPQKKSYLKGATIGSVWDDISPINSQAEERLNYPTQKPEELLERIIYSTSNEGDIVLDCFAGSGTTVAVAEKLGRRWIAMDCGKLAIYTIQKRMFSLSESIGALRTDRRSETERIENWEGHLKSVPGLLLVTEKARNGECEISMELLYDLAALVKKHSFVKKDKPVSLICPKSKLLIPFDELDEAGESLEGKRIVVNDIEFRLSIIDPKEKPQKQEALPPKEFALYRAGIYDMAAIMDLPWESYRPFVLKLFGIREHSHKRYGLQLDGYVGTHSALLWNYPDQKQLTLDYGYVDDLHRTLRGKRGERFYVVAPVMAMDFAEDELVLDEATYIFLKVPLSVLMRLIEQKEPAAFEQPVKEEDVNAVVDAVGFDFISQPYVEWSAKKAPREGEMFSDYILEITKFRSQTLATDLEDFENFETFSMAMMDLDYDGEVFRLSQVHWGEEVIKAAGGLGEARSLELRVEEKDFNGNQMAILLCDCYGNEKALLLKKSRFEGPRRTAKKKSPKKAAKKKAVKNERRATR
jgi:DNA modification methylase